MPSKADLITTQALVYSVDWFQGNRNDLPHYTVVYSYQVGDDWYTGTFYDYGHKEQDSYLHRDDTITIRYNPANPQKSFYGEAVPSMLPGGLTVLLVGLGSALFVCFIAWLLGWMTPHR